MCVPLACQRSATGKAPLVCHAMPPPFRVAWWHAGWHGGLTTGTRKEIRS